MISSLRFRLVFGCISITPVTFVGRVRCLQARRRFYYIRGNYWHYKLNPFLTNRKLDWEFCVSNWHSGSPTVWNQPNTGAPETLSIVWNGQKDWILNIRKLTLPEFGCPYFLGSSHICSTRIDVAVGIHLKKNGIVFHRRKNRVDPSNVIIDTRWSNMFAMHSNHYVKYLIALLM